ncbi:MAG: class B sortase [Butyrivibrio sp.]
MNNTNFPNDNSNEEEDIEFVSIKMDGDSDDTESSSASMEETDTGKTPGSTDSGDTPDSTDSDEEGSSGGKIKFSKKDIPRYIVMFICLAVFIFSLSMLIYYISGYIKARSLYNDIDSDVRETSDGTTEYVDDNYNKYSFEIGSTIDFEQLKEINPDTIGWISIPVVGIEYPLVQGTDNDYYLHHAHNKAEMYAGAIFMDYRSSADFSDRHTFIYGHHMQDSSMFTKLLYYDDEDFYNAHSDENYFYIYTEENVRVYQIFAVADTDVYTHPIPFSLYVPSIYSVEEFVAAVREVQLYDTGLANLTENDSIVTLMTCQTNSQSDTRHLVYGKLITIVDN